MLRHDAKRCGNVEDKYDKLSQVIPILRTADPTEHLCTYLEWICKSYLRDEFLLEDVGMLREDLELFHKNKMRLVRRDINAFNYPQLKVYLDDNLRKVQLDDTVYLEDENKKVLYSGPLGTLIVPLTYKGSVEVGSGTRWCTAGKTCDMFDRYSEQGPLYVWIDKQYKLRKGKSKKYQFHFESEQFMDEKDVELHSELLTYFRLEHPIISALFSKYEEELKTKPSKITDYCTRIRVRLPILEPYIITSHDLYDYSMDVLGFRWDNKEIERRLVMSYDRYSTLYLAYLGITLNFDILIDDGIITGEEADSILKAILTGSVVIKDAYFLRGKAVPELEPYIKLCEPETIIKYCLYSRRSRWIEIEGIILESSIMGYLITYACEYLGKRWVGLESLILNNFTNKTNDRPFSYANICMNRRWRELELLYSTSPTYKLNYNTCDNFNTYIKRFVRPGNNKDIMQLAYINANTSYTFAKYVLKTRWTDAPRLNKNIDFEGIIFRDLKYGFLYIDEFIHERVPEYEKTIISSSNDHMHIGYVAKYVRDIVGYTLGDIDDKYRNHIDYYTIIHDIPASEEQERIWISSIDEIGVEDLINYSIKFKKDRWIELEDIILTSNSGGYCLPYYINYGRVIEHEGMIKISDIALDYARLVMFKEWPEAEQYIVDKMELSNNMVKYIAYTRKRPWPEVMKLILENAMECVDYSKLLVGGEWGPGHAKIGTSYKSRYYYSKDVIHGPLPLSVPYSVHNEYQPKYHYMYLDYIKSLEE